MEVTVNKVPGQRKGCFIYTSNNYIYHRHKSSAVSVSYRCRQYETLENCMARITFRDGIYRTNGREHSHWNEAEEIQRIAAVNECVERAGEQRNQLKRIFEEVRDDHPDALLEYNPALKRRMQRAKRAKQPAIPQSVEEVAQPVPNAPVPPVPISDVHVVPQQPPIRRGRGRAGAGDHRL